MPEPSTNPPPSMSPTEDAGDQKKKRTVNREPTACVIMRENDHGAWSQVGDEVKDKAAAQRKISQERMSGKLRIVRVLYEGTPVHKPVETVKTEW